MNSGAFQCLIFLFLKNNYLILFMYKFPQRDVKFVGEEHHMHAGGGH